MKYKQRGASYIGIFFGIVLAAFAMKLAVAIWPAYWDDRVINKLIEDTLIAVPKDATQKRFRDELDKRFQMNNISGVKVDEVVQVTNTAGLVVKKNYEVRKPFVMNIDLVMTFEKDFDQRSVATQ